jgi:hypothetical protein
MIELLSWPPTNKKMVQMNSPQTNKKNEREGRIKKIEGYDRLGKVWRNRSFE